MSWLGTSAEHAASLTGFPSWNVRTGLRVFGGLHKGELAVWKVLAERKVLAVRKVLAAWKVLAVRKVLAAWKVLAVRKVLAPSIHQYHTKSLIQGERLHPDHI